MWSIAFEPSGEHMVSSSDDCTLRIWRCGRQSGPDAAAASAPPGQGGADGAAGSSGRSVLPPWSLSSTLAGHHSRCVYSCDWGPGGLIAAGDGDNQIRVYALEAGAGPSEQWVPVAMAEGAHSQDVNCVKWHPSDPTLLASAGDDGLVRLWRFEGLHGIPGA